MSVVKFLELSAQSVQGYEDAVRQAVERATSGSFAVRFGIYLAPLGGYASGVCACRLQSRRAGGSAGHRSDAAVGVCRSTQTGSAAYSRRAPFAQTRPRSPRGCAAASLIGLNSGMAYASAPNRHG